MAEDFLKTPFMENLIEDSLDNHIAIIQEDSARYLRNLIQQKQTQTLLEIGTGFGYSTFCWAQAMMPWQGKVVTMERLIKRVNKAKEYSFYGNFRNIDFVCGMVPFDLYLFARVCDGIFVDAAIGQYLEIWHYLTPYVKPGGFFAFDNMNVKGLLSKSWAEIPRRHRTIYKRLYEFMSAVEAEPGWKVKKLHLGDGLLIAEKLGG